LFQIEILPLFYAHQKIYPEFINEIQVGSFSIIF